MAEAKQSNSNSLLSVRNLARSFRKLEVLKEINFELFPGDRLVLIGPNGAGKTTLLRILTQQLFPTSGSLEFEGKDLRKHAKYCRSQMGYLPASENSFFPRLTGRENLQLFTRLQGASLEQYEKQLEEWKEITVFQNALRARYLYCSSGMKQSLALFRAMVHNPKLLVLDEPLRAFDEASQKIFMDMILKFTSTEGRALLFVSHLQEFQNELANRELRLRDGRIHADTDSFSQ